MDFSTLVPAIVSAVAALVAAWLGHTAGSKALSADVRKLLADVQNGHSLPALRDDVSDLKQLLDDIRTVLQDAKTPKAGA